MGLREEILAFDDRRIAEVKAFGRTLWVRSMSAHERDVFEVGCMGSGKSKDDPSRLIDIRAKFVAQVLCDADGKRIFSDADVPALSAKMVPEIDKVWEAGRKLNAITEDDLKELAGN